jgi:hypothetical protein
MNSPGFGRAKVIFARGLFGGDSYQVAQGARVQAFSS